jgi:hypothetical protein
MPKSVFRDGIMENLEEKLLEIKYTFHLLYFIVNGFKNLELIDNVQLASLEYLIEESINFIEKMK